MVNDETVLKIEAMDGEGAERVKGLQSLTSVPISGLDSLCSPFFYVEKNIVIVFKTLLYCFMLYSTKSLILADTHKIRK